MSSTKVLIICSRLDLPGGIEKATVNVANLFALYGHEVTLLVLDETEKSFYAINKDIKLLQHPLHFGITSQGNFLSRKIAFLKHIKFLRKLIYSIKADVIVTTEYVFTVTAQLAKNKDKKLFSWEHHHFHWLNKSKFWDLLCMKLYPKVYRVICLNKVEAELFSNIGCQTSVIPNFVLQQQKAVLSTKTILTVGWLINRKGVDLIPSIAKVVFQRYQDWKWRIIGSGEEYDTLMRSIKENHLAQKISIIPPSSPDLEQEYLNASIYVMTSRFECFPMVLLEAMSHGIPCISYNCPTGPADIIKHEEDGLLVDTENIKGMAEAICRIIENEELRMKMGENAHINVQRFSPENIYKLWDAVLRPTTQKSD
jgi:glycosyltransferase involved in cell wall biosynthesis